MNIIKFTSDGKKVLIVGKLNAQETIVQEIFITQSGAEIPSGENFVVKSLHDEPAVSWKEKNIKDLEKTYVSDHKEWIKKIDNQNRILRQKEQEIKCHIESIGQVTKLSGEDSFKRLSAFLAGEIKYVVLDPEYAEIKICKWSEFSKFNDYGLRLVSLFGKENGTLQFRIHSYSDGSGGSNRIVPFYTFDEAIAYAQRWIDSKDVYYEGTVKCAAEYGLSMDPIKMEKYTVDTINDYKKRIDAAENNLEKEKERLSAFIEIT